MTATLTRPRLAYSTFSVTGGLANDYIERGELIPWSGTLVVEGIETGDRRGIVPGALSWRDLPLPFMVQLENPVGGKFHDGAKLTGRIDTIERVSDTELFATGFIDPKMPDGVTYTLALDQMLMMGVSVDMDMVSTMVVELADGPREVITGARIMGATGCPFQAFMEAHIQLDVDRMSPALAASAGGRTATVYVPVDELETLIRQDALVASGGAIPVEPPKEWFDMPQLSEYTALSISRDGRILGHIAAWGTCHISFADRCVPVPRSAINYGAFHVANVMTSEGVEVKTGQIVMDTVHPDLRWQASDAQAFYADTGCAVADVRAYEDRFGIVVAGALRPSVSPVQLRAFRGSDISPDWRLVNGNPHECCAMLAVNNSGFKPPALAASAGLYVEPGQTAIAVNAMDEVYALVASGPMSKSACPTCAVLVDEIAEMGADCGCDATHDCGCGGHVEVTEAEFAVELGDPRLEALLSRFGTKPPPRRRFVRASPVP